MLKSYQELMIRVQGILKEKPLEGMPDFLNSGRLMEMAKRELPNMKEGPKPALWNHFSLATNGLRENGLTVLCGITGGGKTTFCANLAAFLMVKGIKPYVMSAEIGPLNYFRAMMSAFDARDYSSQTNLPLEEIEKFEYEWGPLIGKDGIHFSKYENKVHPHVVLCDLLYACEELGCKVAFIDNINFIMPVIMEENANSRMDQTIHDFITFCKAVPMHVILIMHPKKTLNGRVNNEFDVKGSSGVVQEATNVWLWNRPEGDDYPSHNHRELTFAKIRYNGKFHGKKIIFENCNGSYVERAFI